MRDNHIFRALATVAAYGTPLKDAAAAGKDALARVGAKGAAAEAARALVAAMTPTLLPPEALHAALGLAADSQAAQRLVADVAREAPHLFARSLPQVAALFEADDPLLAGVAVAVLGAAGREMVAHAAAQQEDLPAGVSFVLFVAAGCGGRAGEAC